LKSETIKKLSEVDHILKRPAMYIGSVVENSEPIYTLQDGNLIKDNITFVQGVITCFNEIVANSIDEFQKTDGKFANKIQIKVKPNMISVKDNGRGLSHVMDKDEKLPHSVLAFTHPRAGSNFNDSTTSIGQNGIGAWGVACFSKKFDVDTCDGKKRTVINCKDNLSEIQWSCNKKTTRYTTVKYSLDFDRFGLTSLDDNHFNILKRIVYDYKMCYPDINFIFNSEKVDIKSFKDYVGLYNENVEVFDFENVSVGIFSSGDFEQVSFVNGINTTKGGTHVDIITGNVVKDIREKLIKKYKTIKPADIKNKLTFVIKLKNLTAPRFTTQTKNELTNKPNEFDEHIFSDFDVEKIAKKLFKNKLVLSEIIEYFKIKEEFKKRKELETKEKKVKVKDLSKFMEANSKTRKKCSLYIGEGKSAVGSMFITCRDSNFDAGYALRGKFKSCQGVKPVELMKNQEISDICAITGLRLSSPDISNIRFGKINIMTDQDPDGFAIKAGLTNFFYTFWPDIIRKGILHIAESPLIRASKDGKTYNFFSIEEYDQANVDGNYKIDKYNKGLGSLSPEDYIFTMGNLVKVKEDERSRESLDIAFDKEDSDKRKEWMSEI